MTEHAQGSPYRAAIDIGTNSMHLVVAKVGEHGGFEILTSEKEMVRLGQGGGDMKRLAPAAIDRGIEALSRMAKVAASFGEVQIVAVATSAVREAENKQDFIERARNEVGVEVEVISGFEEARLIHLGVLQALPVFDQRLLLVDIGGGSTEFLVGEGARAIEARSLRLGAIRLTERFFPDIIVGDGSVDADSVADCRQYLRAALSPVSHELGGHQPEIAVASSGTAATVATIAAAARGEDVRQINGLVFSADELASVAEQVASTNTAGRKKIDGLDAKRVDIIVAGALLLDEIGRAFSVPEFTMSDYALREGVLFDRFGPSGDQSLEDLRRSNLLRLARQLDPDPEHSVQTAELATQLFDRTRKLHRLGPAERELLEAASIVHNVGLFISHSGHHKHSYYVIRNSEQLTGFTERELELIALIARYHRKSQPTEKHPEFAALSKREKRVVRVLAGMLRIAIGLDRRHAASVSALRVFVLDDRVEIEPVAADGSDLEVEIYAARDRARLLASAFGVDVVVRPPAVFDTDLVSS